MYLRFFLIYILVTPQKSSVCCTAYNQGNCIATRLGSIMRWIKEVAVGRDLLMRVLRESKLTKEGCLYLVSHVFIFRKERVGETTHIMLSILNVAIR